MLEQLIEHWYYLDFEGLVEFPEKLSDLKSPPLPPLLKEQFYVTLVRRYPEFSAYRAGI